MVYLQMKAMDFGISDEAVKQAGLDCVQAPYETLDAARAQAKHNIDTGKQVPLRIVDEQGETLVDYES